MKIPIYFYLKSLNIFQLLFKQSFTHVKDCKLLEKKDHALLRGGPLKREIFLEKLSKIPIENRIYLDENKINKYLYKAHVRCMRGKKVIGEVSGMRYARESFISALHRVKVFCPMCFKGTCNSDLFNVWLKEMLIPNLPPGQVLILDNASFHRSEKTRVMVENAGCEILFLPPYSSDLTPIEKYWANLKVKIRELLKKYKNLRESIDQVILSM